MCDDGISPERGPLAYESGKNLQSSAQNRVAACSVACLEVNMRGRKNRFKTLWPLGLLLSLPETMLAKEAKTMTHLAVENT